MEGTFNISIPTLGAFFTNAWGPGKVTVKFPGAGNSFCANARGVPGGGKVRTGIERDIRNAVPLGKKFLAAMFSVIIY